MLVLSFGRFWNNVRKYTVFIGISYIKIKKDLMMLYLDFNVDGVIDYLLKLSIYYRVRKKYKDMWKF